MTAPNPQEDRVSRTLTPRTDEAEDRCKNCGLQFVNSDDMKKLELALAAAEARAREAEKDTARLDWVEMLTIPSDEIDDLVRNWKVDGKRYPEGIRAAIDAAIALGEQGREKG